MLKATKMRSIAEGFANINEATEPIDPDTLDFFRYPTLQEVTIVRCRLSNRQLRRLTRQYGDTIDLHPLESMMDFPFIPVRVHRVGYVNGQPLPVVPVYSPPNVFQDVPPTLPESEPFLFPFAGVQDWSDPDVEMRIPEFSPPLDDWEVQDLSLNSGFQAPTLPASADHPLPRIRRTFNRAFRHQFLEDRDPSGPSDTFGHRYSRKQKSKYRLGG